MDNRAIGIYDSGIGGLTALKTLRRLMPEENIVFFADSGRLPYGPRPQEELRAFARQDMAFLGRFGVKAILAACGTISSAAAAEIAAWPVPAFGVLEPAIEAMAAVEGAAPLAVLATEGSIRSGRFTGPLRARCPGREVLGLACPDFAPAIEAGHIRPEDPVLREITTRTLAPLKEAGCAAVLLGCTHYGIIADAIREVLGPGPALISAADCGARQLCDYLRAAWLEARGGGRTEFYISCGPRDFEDFAGRWLEQGPVRAVQVPREELERL